MIVYNYDADLEVSDTCVRSSLLIRVEPLNLHGSSFPSLVSLSGMQWCIKSARKDRLAVFCEMGSAAKSQVFYRNMAWTGCIQLFRSGNMGSLVRGLVTACTNHVEKILLWKTLQPRCLKLYDTIRDAILTYARKPTWVSLIYEYSETRIDRASVETLRWLHCRPIL